MIAVPRLLVVDNEDHTYYFHVVSAVGQAPLVKRQAAKVHHTILATRTAAEEGSGLNSALIVPTGSSPASTAWTFCFLQLLLSYLLVTYL